MSQKSFVQNVKEHVEWMTEELTLIMWTDFDLYALPENVKEDSSGRRGK